MTKRPVNLRLDDDLVLAADALATSIGTDRTELVSRGLRRELLYDGAREFIYVLLDQERTVRYVGRSRDPHNRLRQHLAEARMQTRSAKERWIAEMAAAGLEPTVVIIDDAEPGEPVAELEREWIDRLKSSVLTNGIHAGVVRGRLQAVSKSRSIRFPDDLDARMKAAAEADRRSLSSWVIVACEQALTASAREAVIDPIRLRGSVKEIPPPQRSNIGPKSEAASKPIPKTGKSKR